MALNPSAGSPVLRFPTFRAEIPAFYVLWLFFPPCSQKRLRESRSFPWEARSERGKFGEFQLGVGVEEGARPKPGEIPEFVPFPRAVPGLGSWFNRSWGSSPQETEIWCCCSISSQISPSKNPRRGIMGDSLAAAVILTVGTAGWDFNPFLIQPGGN